jgi:uncharacterized membrane protein
MYIPSGYYRKKALDALKGHWQTALLIALIVNLPTLLMQGFSVFSGNDLTDRLQAVVVSASRDGVMTPQLILDEMNAILYSTAFWTIRGLEILAWLITPCLTLGMYKWLLDRLQGQTGPVDTVFSRMRQFLKAIGLQLLIILKILLWMLPGLAVMTYLIWPVFQATDLPTQLAAVQRSYSMTLPVLLLTAVPAGMAALRYAMSEYIMAEEPGSKILYCIRHSKELMREQKRSLFLLVVSFLLWYLLEVLISSMLPGVLSLVFQMLAGLAITVYMSCSIAAFYLRLKNASEKHEDPNADPEPEELN